VPQLRLTERGDSYKAEGNLLGLEWINEEWLRQNRHEDDITERELRETLEEIKWLMDCCLAMKRLAGILHRSPDLPDEHPITGAGWFIPWRTDKEPLLFLRDLRLAEDELGGSARS